MKEKEVSTDSERAAEADETAPAESVDAAKAGEAPAGRPRRRIFMHASLALGAAAFLVLAAVLYGTGTAGGNDVRQDRGGSVHLTVKAPGWSRGDGSFGFAIVAENGKSASTGKISPVSSRSIDLRAGTYAVSLTSLPTARDAKTTWAVPQPVQFELNGKDAKAELVLTQIDLTDDAGLNSVLEALPEDQREATRKIVENKRSDPSSDSIDRPPSKPLLPPHGGSGDSGRGGSGSGSSGDSGRGGSGSGSGGRHWGVVKAAWDENVTVRDAWDEQVQIKAAWDEQVVDRPAWSETVNHPAEYRTEKVKVGVYFMAKDGTTFNNENDAAMYYKNTGIPYSVLPKYEDRQVLVKEAWTEQVNHAATYRTVHHDAVTKTVHHGAETRLVHHPDEYGWIKG